MRSFTKQIFCTNSITNVLTISTNNEICRRFLSDLLPLTILNLKIIQFPYQHQESNRKFIDENCFYLHGLALTWALIIHNKGTMKHIVLGIIPVSEVEKIFEFTCTLFTVFAIYTNCQHSLFQLNSERVLSEVRGCM